MAVAAACSAPGEGTGSSESALAESGRWALPASVLATGATVRVSYDDAPKWTNSAACGGKLLPGGKKLGEFLIDNFDAVTSVGGYACRRNTADSSRMSVHGTGRALDVFIPTVGGAADNGRGDKVANWLVTHAQQIGVQLVIWDRSIWRSNGTNDRAYTGPNPHVDHIHVELTKLASALGTPWFEDMTNDTNVSTTDGGSTRADGSTDSGTPRADAGTTVDAAPPVEVDAGVTDPDPNTDAGTGDPADDDHAHDDEVDAATDAATSPKGDTLPKESPSEGLESAGDAPGEEDSIPEATPARRKSMLDTASQPNAGCSTSSSGSSNPMGTMGLSLAVGVVIAAMRRRRARD